MQSVPEYRYFADSPFIPWHSECTYLSQIVLMKSVTSYSQRKTGVQCNLIYILSNYYYTITKKDKVVLNISFVMSALLFICYQQLLVERTAQFQIHDSDFKFMYYKLFNICSIYNPR